MLKPELFKLIEDVKACSDVQTPIIVGSQAAHASGGYVPSIARTSVECDFLFAGKNSETPREIVNKKLGVLTEYQDELLR